MNYEVYILKQIKTVGDKEQGSRNVYYEWSGDIGVQTAPE